MRALFQRSFANYKMITHIFDCDGVITDTNNLKKIAFQKVAEKNLPKKYIPYLLDFHLKNGGKSRWEKFEYIKKKFILDDFDVDASCLDFADYVEKQMYKEDLIPSVKDYINEIIKSHNNYIYVASAGETDQIKRLIKHHKLCIKEENIFGSPLPKLEIVKNIRNKNINRKIVLYGDSLHDAECAFQIDAKFVFIYGYTKQKLEDFTHKYDVKITSKDFSNLTINQISALFS
tara:strand:+ start:2519 stop:3214 length:696 start_codon:yes stop_codon:yes gene_type:complete